MLDEEIEFAKKHLEQAKKTGLEKRGELAYMGINISQFNREDLLGMIYELQQQLTLKSETLEKVISMELKFLHYA